MNKKLFNLVLVLLLAVSVISFSYDVNARGTWTSPDTIDPANTPLEVSAGRTFSNGNIYDTFIVLNQGPQTSLQVYNVEATQEGCVLAGESTITGFDGPLFGSSHTIQAVLPGFFSTTPVFYSCVVDDFRLKALRSEDGGLTWNVITVSPNDDYGSCETIVDPFNPTALTIGGCNFNNNSYDGFLWNSNTNSFQLDDTVNSVNCAIQGAIRATANKIDGVKYLLHGRLQGNDQEILLNIGGNSNLIDLSVKTPVGTIAETVQPIKTGPNFVVGAYANFGDNSVNTFKVRRGGKGPTTVTPVVDIPAFNNFFGMAGFVSQLGVYDLLVPGGTHIQYSLNTHSVVNINTNGNFGLPNGPIGVTQLTDSNLLQVIGAGINPNDISVRAAYMDNSVGCGQFFLEPLSIPTLSEWGLIALSGVLMLSGAFYLRRKVSA